MRFTRWLSLIALAALVALPGCNRGDHPEQTGKLAPDFKISDGSTSINLADYRGKVVLLNFWWSQCGPCIAELPSLLRLHHDDPNLVILAISIDEDPGNYERFIKQRHVDLITVRDPNQSVPSLYHTDMWPETYLIDRKGIIRRKFVGAQDWSDPEIRQYIANL
ncbi:MAG TPA: TlpA disulfide reductase family protein [Terracidiphilus sp.]|nr:TlpA disulfide reductase family protein [Terracidiphilus sp.]